MTQFNDLPKTFMTETAPMTEAEKLTAKANQAISGLKDQYLTQTKADIQQMKEFLTKAKFAKEAKRFKLIRTDFFQKMHDMKGLGSTFGYPLLTTLGAYACDYLRTKQTISDQDLEKLSIILSDVEMVMTHDLVGTGGALGAEIYAHIS